VNENGWLLVGISGIVISSRIKKVVGGWDAKEAPILHRHSLMGKYGSCNLVCISPKINGLTISSQKSPHPQPPCSLLLLLPLYTLIESF